MDLVCIEGAKAAEEVFVSRTPSPDPTLFIPGTICIEGNIGSGKSTLLGGLREAGYWVAEEPVKEIWGDYLGTLYSDQKRWGFTFQIEVVDWYKGLVQRLQKDPVVTSAGGGVGIKIVERSPTSTYQIFGKNLRRQGNLTAWEMKLLGKVVESWAWLPEHTFYVQTPYELAFERLRLRNRCGEEEVPIELLRQLEIQHEAFMKSKYCGRAHYLDGSLSKKELVAQAIEKIKEIQNEKTTGVLSK